MSQPLPLSALQQGVKAYCNPANLIKPIRAHTNVYIKKYGLLYIPQDAQVSLEKTDVYTVLFELNKCLRNPRENALFIDVSHAEVAVSDKTSSPMHFLIVYHKAHISAAVPA